MGNIFYSPGELYKQPHFMLSVAISLGGRIRNNIHGVFFASAEHNTY
jgi:hypothetical protein